MPGYWKEISMWKKKLHHLKDHIIQCNDCMNVTTHCIIICFINREIGRASVIGKAAAVIMWVILKLSHTGIVGPGSLLGAFSFPS
jgi:hypothetical protein